MSYSLIHNDSLLGEILAVVKRATDNGRDKLNESETEFVVSMTKRMVKEYKGQFNVISKYRENALRIMKDTLDMIT